MTHRRSSSSSHRAYTLVELIACVAVLGVIGTLSSKILLQAVTGERAASVRSQLVAENSLAMERLCRSIRQIERQAAGGPSIDSITSTSLHWEASKSLELQGGELRLSDDGGPAALLLPNVSGFTLRALGADGSPLSLPLAGAACRSIRRVEIDMTATRSGASARLRTHVFTRAAMDPSP